AADLANELAGSTSREIRCDGTGASACGLGAGLGAFARPLLSRAKSASTSLSSSSGESLFTFPALFWKLSLLFAASCPSAGCWPSKGTPRRNSASRHSLTPAEEFEFIAASPKRYGPDE